METASDKSSSSWKYSPKLPDGWTEYPVNEIDRKKCTTFMEHMVALFYNKGFNVFPCSDGFNPKCEAKKPLWKYVKYGRMNACKLRKYFKITQLYGIMTGDLYKGKYLIGVDCDNKNGKCGVENLKKEFGIEDGDTFTVRTATGNGRHFWFLSDVPLNNGVSIVPGVDIRGYHGFLFLPGSTYYKDGQEFFYRAISKKLEFSKLPDSLHEAIIEHQLETKKAAKEKIKELEIENIDKEYVFDYSDEAKVEELGEKVLREMNEHISGIIEPKPNREYTTVEEYIEDAVFAITNAVEGTRNNTLYTWGSFLFSMTPHYVSEQKISDLLNNISILPAKETTATVESSKKSDRAHAKFAIPGDPNYREIVLKNPKSKLYMKYNIIDQALYVPSM